MPRLISLLLLLMLLTSSAAEGLQFQQFDSPQTPEQRLLCDLSAHQSARVIANMLATREEELELFHDAEAVDDPLYAFILSAESGLPDPVSVTLLMPTAQFGKGGLFSEFGITDPDIWSSRALNLPMSVSYYANNQSHQAIFLESMSVTQPVEAWSGPGVAYAIRYYGEGQPQFITALSLDSPCAVAKTTMLFYRQIADRPVELFDAALRWYGEDGFDLIVIKPE